MGGYHSCFVSNATTSGLLCFGENGDGQLGYEDTIDRGDCGGTYEDISNLAVSDLGSDFGIAQIQIMGNHNCILSTNGELKCFGYNHYGNLGYNDTENRGDDSNEMADYLEIVDLDFTANPTTAPTDDMWIGNEYMDFDDAQDYCQSLGGDLLSIHSEETQEAAAALCDSFDHSEYDSDYPGCWIGLFQPNNDEWQWSDGSDTDLGFHDDGRVSTGDYPWSNGEPNDWDEVEDCVYIMSDNLKWNDKYCGGLKVPICSTNTNEPTSDPTAEPTNVPTIEPTVDSTADADPTSEPSKDPTTEPTSTSTDYPVTPTENHSVDPTTEPTSEPTSSPTAFCESIYIQIENFEEFTSSTLNDVTSYQIKMANLTQSAIAMHVNTSQHALSGEEFYVQFETSYGSLFVVQSLCALTEHNMVILTHVVIEDNTESINGAIEDGIIKSFMNGEDDGSLTVYISLIQFRSTDSVEIVGNSSDTGNSGMEFQSTNSTQIPTDFPKDLDAEESGAVYILQLWIVVVVTVMLCILSIFVPYRFYRMRKRSIGAVKQLSDIAISPPVLIAVSPKNLAVKGDFESSSDDEEMYMAALPRSPQTEMVNINTRGNI